MPNIELHGFGKLAESMKLQIRTALLGLPFVQSDEIFTTIYPTETEDSYDNRRSFLRIVAVPTELPELLVRLRKLNEVIEVLHLAQLIPKQKK